MSSNSEKNTLPETLACGFPPKYLLAFVSANHEGIAHRHDHFELVYHAEGSGVIEYPDQKITFGKGSWSLAGPGVTHHQNNFGDYEDVCLLFSLDNVKLPSLHFELRPSAELLNAAEELRTLVQCGLAGVDRWRQLELNCRTGVILSAVLQRLLCPESAQQPGNPEWYADRAEKMIRRNGFTNLPMAEIARDLHIGADHLRHTYRAARGRSLKSFFTETRLQYAAQLLGYGGLSVKVIADRCGYASASHFCSDYRKFFGITPGKQMYNCGDTISKNGGQAGN